MSTEERWRWVIPSAQAAHGFSRRCYTNWKEGTLDGESPRCVSAAEMLSRWLWSAKGAEHLAPLLGRVRGVVSFAGLHFHPAGFHTHVDFPVRAVLIRIRRRVANVVERSQFPRNLVEGHS